MSPQPNFFKSRQVFILICAVAALGTITTLALLGNIQQPKTEQKNPYFRVVKVTADDTNPAHWGKNWPAQYDSYRRTALPTKTRFGGYAGSEALREEKIERDPWLKRMFLGYAFSIDYRDRQGHA